MGIVTGSIGTPWTGSWGQAVPYYRERDKKWLGQVRHNGEKHVSPPFEKKADAKAWEVRTRKELKHFRPVGTACGDLSEKYLDFVQLKFTPKTYNLKFSILKEFLAHVGPTTPAESVTPGQCQEFLQSVARGRTGGQANTYRTHLAASWNWGKRFLDIQSNPFTRTELFPVDRADRYIPPMDDFLAVLNATSGQDRILLLTYLHTAARRNELFRLRWADVDFGSQRIQLWTRKTKGKGWRGDWIDMTDELAATLLQWRQEAPSDMYVFVKQPRKGQHTKRVGDPYETRHTWLPIVCERAGVRPFGFHAIRHLTAAYLANAGVPMITIQSVLRHQSLAVTEKYLHQIKSQRAALSLLPGGKSPQKSPQGLRKPKNERN